MQRRERRQDCKRCRECFSARSGAKTGWRPGHGRCVAGLLEVTVDVDP